MAGIYIHVPFCKTKCIYCDFFTKTNLKQKNPFVDALSKEIILRKDYIEDETVSTIYFGGGTPSQLAINDINVILDRIKDHYTIDSDVEITLEANPDDLNEKFLDQLINIGINRLSLGIQSFDDNLLNFLNRRHSAQKAYDSVKIAQKTGFYNISIDLMYGLPNQNMALWEQTLSKAISLDIQHISSYHLIYEEGTKLYRMLDQKNITPIKEDISVEMFSTMIDKLEEANFIQYEISSFGKKEYFSRHNSSYWLGKKYLGLGPAAHSYDQKNRSWNIASIPKYIDAINQNKPNIEIEQSTQNSRYNDYILTGMRTIWGINKNCIQELFGIEKLIYCEKNLKKHIDNKLVILEKDTYKLTREGIFISDSIMSDLMYID